MHLPEGGRSNPCETEPQISEQPVAWFDLAKQFGFVALSNGSGDAFLHMSVLKGAGFVWGFPVGPRYGSGLRRMATSGGWLRVWRLIPARPDPGKTSRSKAQAQALITQPQ